MYKYILHNYRDFGHTLNQNTNNNIFLFLFVIQAATKYREAKLYCTVVIKMIQPPMQIWFISFIHKLTTEWSNIIIQE